MTIAPSSDGWRSTHSQDADDDVQAVVEEDRGLLVDAGDVQPPRGVGPEHDDAIGARGVAGVGHAAGLQLRAHRAPEPRRGGLDRNLKARLAERVVDRHRADELAADVDVRQRAGGDDAVEALQAILGAERQHARRRRRAAARRRDDDVRRGDLVEVADDLVGGGLREAERRDERRDADDRAQHRQRDPRRPREQARARLGEQVAQRQPGGRGPAATRAHQACSRRRPSTMLVRRGMRGRPPRRA